MILLIVLFATWSPGWIIQSKYDREMWIEKMDWNDHGYCGRALVYISYGSFLKS